MILRESKLLNVCPELTYGVSTVEEGNMSFKWGEADEVIASRSRFLDQIDIKPEYCVSTRLRDHTDIVETVGRMERGRAMTDPGYMVMSDALVTVVPETGLFMYAGDCPIAIMFDPKAGILGLVHLSWQTTSKQLAVRTVGVMVENLGVDPADLLVYLSPGIQKNSYRFVDPAQKQMPDWKPYIEDQPDGSTAIDVQAYNRAQLQTAGVRRDNIEISAIDTATDSRFFSHYRDSRAGKPEGRSAVAAMIRRN